MAATMGVTDVKVGIGTALPVTQALEVVSENLTRRGSIARTAGLRGTRQMPIERSRRSTNAVGGTLVMNPAPDELAALLPWILGANAVGTTFSLAETLQERYVSVLRGPQLFNYAGAKVGVARFRAGQGALLELQLDIVAKSVTLDVAASYPAISPTTNPPYHFADAVLTLAAVAYNMFDVEIVVDNKLNTSRFMNSLNLTEIPSEGLEISLTTTTPFTSTEMAALFATAANLSGLAGSVAFTNGGYSATFTFPALQAPDEDPSTPGPGEVTLPLRFTALRTGSTPPLSVVNDSTA